MIKGENFKIHEHNLTSIHVFDAPSLDGNDESKNDEAVSFIDKYMYCSRPTDKANPKRSSLVKEVQTHNHSTSCRKKK